MKNTSDVLKDDSVSSFWYLLGGICLGAGAAALAVYASKEDENGETLISRISSRIPTRVKAAAGYGAVKEGGREAFRGVRERAEEAVGGEA